MELYGELQVIFGPMFSGKSTELCRRLRNYKRAGKPYLAIKHGDDKRYSTDKIVTHDGESIPSVVANTIEEGIKAFPDAEIIGIDEGQFFPDLVVMCEKLVNSGKIVIVAALNGNFKREPFSNTIGLFSKADDVVDLKAICMVCCKPSSFSKRITDEKDEIVIDGKDKYITVCRTCYFN